MPAIAKKGILYTETPSVENRVVEGNQNPVTSGAVYKELGDTSVNNDLGANVSNQIGNLHTQMQTNRVQLSLDAVAVGKDEDGDTIYEKTFKGTTISSPITVVDSNLTISKLKWIHLVGGCFSRNGASMIVLPYDATISGRSKFIVYSNNDGLVVDYYNVTVTMYHFTVQYVLK